MPIKDVKINVKFSKEEIIDMQEDELFEEFENTLVYFTEKMNKMENSKGTTATDWEILGGLCFEISSFMQIIKEVENETLN